MNKTTNEGRGLSSEVLITPEILKNLGFSYGVTEGIASLDDDERSGDTHYWEKHISRNDYVDPFDFLLVKWGEEQEYFTFSNQWLRIRLKYLDQLERLYFAISGESLTSPIELPNVQVSDTTEDDSSNGADNQTNNTEGVTDGDLKNIESILKENQRLKQENEKLKEMITEDQWEAIHKATNLKMAYNG